MSHIISFKYNLMYAQFKLDPYSSSVRKVKRHLLIYLHTDFSLHNVRYLLKFPGFSLTICFLKPSKQVSSMREPQQKEIDIPYRIVRRLTRQVKGIEPSTESDLIHCARLIFILLNGVSFSHFVSLFCCFGWWGSGKWVWDR